MLLLAWSIVCGCAPTDPERRVVRVRLNVPEFCPEPDRARYPIQLQAWGDFPATTGTTARLSDPEADVHLPAATRALVARAGAGSWHGVRDGIDADGFDLLLWPTDKTCTLSPGGAIYPGRDGGQALGFSARGQLLLVAGGAGTDQSAASGALAFDTATGRWLPPSAQTELNQRRAYATVTALGDKLLVAGGYDPLSEPVQLWRTAEVFDPATGRFEEALIELVEPRARHAALELPTGETLLVGGLGQHSRIVESVAPGEPRASQFGRATLGTARVDPVALLLDDGRIVIAGGSSLEDGEAQPLGTMEWLLPDASDAASPGTREIPARIGRAFVALPGGGVLAVGGCELREPTPQEEQSEACGLCPRGCPPSTGWDAVWIAPDGETTRFELGFPAPDPVLLPAADGAPYLSSLGRLWRFNPWGLTFEPVVHQPDRVPLSGALGSTIADAPRLPAPVVLDAGAVAWLEIVGGATNLVGYRFATRTSFDQDLELVGNTDPLNGFRPLHLVPDRPGAADGATLTVRFERDDRGRPRLLLGDGYAVLTDVRFANFDLELEIDAGPLPVLRLGSTRLGEASCAWPTARDTSSVAATLRRRERRITLEVGELQTHCEGPSGRLSLALTSQRGSSTSVRRMQIVRQPAARPDR